MIVKEFLNSCNSIIIVGYLLFHLFALVVTSNCVLSLNLGHN